MQTRRGQSIEDASMQMIEDEIGVHNFDKFQWPIVRRVIHTTADFDFARQNTILFSKNAIQDGINALKNGCNIVVDVNGVIGGMNKQNPKNYENEIICKISDQDIADKAKQENKTRSQVSMRMSAPYIDKGIVAIGNAPTALLEIIQMVNQGVVKPALVIGIPVGFISAVESKELLASMTNTEYITNKGRKGGSPVAAAVINALYKLVT